MLIDEAVRSGARKRKACEVLDISLRTYQRWTLGGQVKTNARPQAKRPTPAKRQLHAVASIVMNSVSRRR